MRVWFEHDAIQMDDLGPFPARSLFTILDGDRIHVLTLPGDRQAQLLYNEYSRQDESTFGTASEARAYLDSVFTQAPLGTSADTIAMAVADALSDVPDFTLAFDAAAT